MNTRKTEAPDKFRQERFASSPEFERGLMANLVAKRCGVLERAEDRELIWFLQYLSRAPGGLEKAAVDLLAMFPERVGSKTMQKLGCKPGQTYNAEQVRAIRDELSAKDRFPLRGDPPKNWKIFDGGDLESAVIEQRWNREEEAKSKAYPGSYSASVFRDCCATESDCLSRLLAELCLDPAIKPASVSPGWFPTLIESLRDFQSAWIEARGSGQVVTQLGCEVHETLEYCLDGRCMVLIDGLARTGKTHAAKTWVDNHPGRARYVQVPSGSDDIGFFRAIGAALGVSINLNSKAQQLRDRIEEVLQTGQLAVVFDESHYLWPQSNYREALPGRVNWVMTALVNRGVAVALVTTPQFMRCQLTLERKTHWTGEQFTGRIGHYQKLPDSLSEKDLAAVARALLPEGCGKSVKALVLYAQASAKYLAGIEMVVRRARFMAHKARRDAVIFEDVKAAIESGAIPSDNALHVALAKPPRGTRSRTLAAPARSVRHAAAMPPRRDNFAADRIPELRVLEADSSAA